MKRYVEDIEIIIKGHIERDWSEWLDGIKTHKNADGTTVIAGTVRDQAEMFGILNRLKTLGVRILKIEFSEKEVQEEFQ